MTQATLIRDLFSYGLPAGPYGSYEKYMLFAGWEVRIVKTCDRGLENTAQDNWPNVHFHDSFWREQNLAALNLFLLSIGIDFAVGVPSKALRISRRAVRVFPALSLRRVRPSHETFSVMVFQGKCARSHTGHVINIYYLPAGRSV